LDLLGLLLPGGRVFDFGVVGLVDDEFDGFLEIL
jgi:hypothetical protein